MGRVFSLCARGLESGPVRGPPPASLSLVEGAAAGGGQEPTTPCGRLWPVSSVSTPAHRLAFQVPVPPVFLVPQLECVCYLMPRTSLQALRVPCSLACQVS